MVVRSLNASEDIVEMTKFAFSILDIPYKAQYKSPTIPSPITHLIRKVKDQKKQTQTDTFSPTSRRQRQLTVIGSAQCSPRQELRRQIDAQLAYNLKPLRFKYKSRSLSNLTLVIKDPQQKTSRVVPKRQQLRVGLEDNEAIEQASDMVEIGNEHQLLRLYQLSTKLQTAHANRPVGNIKRKMRSVSRTIFKETLKALHC